MELLGVVLPLHRAGLFWLLAEGLMQARLEIPGAALFAGLALAVGWRIGIVIGNSNQCC